MQGRQRRSYQCNEVHVIGSTDDRRCSINFRKWQHKIVWSHRHLIVQRSFSLYVQSQEPSRDKSCHFIVFAWLFREWRKTSIWIQRGRRLRIGIEEIRIEQQDYVCSFSFEASTAKWELQCSRIPLCRQRFAKFRESRASGTRLISNHENSYRGRRVLKNHTNRMSWRLRAKCLLDLKSATV